MTSKATLSAIVDSMRQDLIAARRDRDSFSAKLRHEETARHNALEDLGRERKKYSNLWSAHCDLQREHAKCGPANSDPTAAQETRDVFARFLESLDELPDLLASWATTLEDQAPEIHRTLRRFCT